MRRMTGSSAARGNVAHVCTGRATLVPSIRTCNTARCSASTVTKTAERTDMLTTSPPNLNYELSYLPSPEGFDPSNLSWSRNGLGVFGKGGACVEGEMRWAVHKT